MNIKNKLEKLEAAHASAAPQCPHSHQRVRFLKPDGSDSIAAEFPQWCECGAEIELREIQFVAAPPRLEGESLEDYLKRVPTVEYSDQSA